MVGAGASEVRTPGGKWSYGRDKASAKDVSGSRESERNTLASPSSVFYHPLVPPHQPNLPGNQRARLLGNCSCLCYRAARDKSGE